MSSMSVLHSQWVETRKRPSNKEIVRRLRGAKTRLASRSPQRWTDSKVKGICAALQVDDHDFWVADNIIMARLGKYSYVEGFLRGTVGKEYNDLSGDERWQATQDYRHRWLDSLIEEFSE